MSSRERAIPEGQDEELTVLQLVLHERRARDRGWWDAMGECFWPDAVVRLSWYDGSGGEFVAASRAMAGRGHRSVHRLGPPVLDLRNDRAVIEVPAAIEVPVDTAGTPATLTSYTRLLYRAERRGHTWRIRSLDPVYERDTLVADVPGATVAVDPAALTAFRDPYRLLAHHLHQLGYEITDDLYGDDRPHAVAQLYRSTFAWLEGAHDD